MPELPFFFVPVLNRQAGLTRHRKESGVVSVGGTYERSTQNESFESTLMYNGVCSSHAHRNVAIGVGDYRRGEKKDKMKSAGRFRKGSGVHGRRQVYRATQPLSPIDASITNLRHQNRYTPQKALFDCEPHRVCCCRRLLMP